MSLEAAGDAAKFVWTTDLKPDEAADQIAELIDSETNNIKAFFAGGTAEPEFSGLCTAFLALEGKEAPGDPAIQSIHNGRTYWFGSAEAKELFDADPEAMLTKIKH